LVDETRDFIERFTAENAVTVQQFIEMTGWDSELMVEMYGEDYVTGLGAVVSADRKHLFVSRLIDSDGEHLFSHFPKGFGVRADRFMGMSGDSLNLKPDTQWIDRKMVRALNAYASAFGQRLKEAMRGGS
jgi:hypothetical protein